MFLTYKIISLSFLPSFLPLFVCLLVYLYLFYCFFFIHLTTQDIRDSTCEAVPVNVKEGASITLNCSVDAYPPASYSWNLGEITEPTSTVILTASPNLHKKSFTCTATNSRESKNCSTTPVNVLCEYQCIKGLCTTHSHHSSHSTSLLK